MTLRTRYTAVPMVPVVGVEEWQSQILNALKENVELLTGTRGEADLASAALSLARVSVTVPPEQELKRITAQGSSIGVPSGFSVSDNTITVTSTVNVPLTEDYNQALADMQTLANDVANLRATVEVLITQLRG